MADLSKVSERDRLKPRPGKAPHWQRLRAGCFLGFRPAIGGGVGTWVARVHDADADKYRVRSLGDFGTLSGSERFAAAKKEAEAWAELVETGGVREEKIETVADAARAYLKNKADANGIAAGVFRRHVFDDPIAKVKLDKLRRHHLTAWRKRLEDAPALMSRNKGGVTRSKKRAASTVNRDMVPLRAALAALLPPGAPGTDAAWQEALKPVKGASGHRTLYLDRDERRKLLAHAEGDVAPFLHALCLLPLRPGTHAGRVAGDFDKRTRTLVIGRETKTGKARKITVPQATADFLDGEAKGKLPVAPLFRQASGKPWDKDAWKGPIKEAALAAGLPSGTCAYTLRHSVITDLVTGGLPILTVAQISGTSVAMIEKHYGHLVGNGAEEALSRLVL
ncbi:integrase [Tsuneonella sp. CC-YZS046]|uniref:tyrosine-type recombinase/integrase n=1 Tax=Tsuneonella sp. CC-YZS046 TaxID=3042152 RepID=UPI002D774024|nr:integrase [Tsuneonella sp. CC-YZS046]WRO65421.1 integrase [Tsuneonella sp. CC-YZS046]